MSAENVLLKKGWRSDAFWTNGFITRTPLVRIPFYFDTKALLKSQYWPRARIDALQYEQLKRVIRHAAKIPFWAERFRNARIDPERFDLNDFARIVVAKKEDFRAQGMNAFIDQALYAQSHALQTSGSTGKPFTLFHDRASELRVAAISERMIRAAGNGVRYPIVIMSSREDMGFGLARHRFFFVRGYNGVRHRFDELAKLLNSFPNGVILYGLASSLVEVARISKERGIVLPIRRVIAGSEKLYDAQKKEIEETFSTDIRVAYGMSEIRRLAFECEHHRLHLNEEWVYFEVTDDEGVPLPVGSEGRILVTAFDNPVMPFIRYDTGDRGVISDEQCPCGRTLRTITMQGRQAHILHFGNDRSVSLLDLLFSFNKYGTAVRQFQIVRSGEYEFFVNVVPAPQFASDQAEIAENLVRVTHPKARFELRVVETIPEGATGKAIYFIDQWQR